MKGHIHTDLFTAKVIEDPYFGTNSDRYRWVCKEDWTYRSDFCLPDTWNQAMALIIFEGLDTIANVTINGHLIGTSDNQFRRHIFRIERSLKSGRNEIEVQFSSSVNYAVKNLFLIF